MPWIAQEAGLFKKYNLDFQLVYVASSPVVTAALLGGEGDIALTGGEGMIRAFVQGARDFVFVGGVKNILTHSIIAKPEIRKAEDLRGKKIGINRIGSNPHYFALQVLRKSGVDPKEVQFIQSGGAPETVAALASGALDAATLTAPADARARSLGFHYVIFGPELKLPYVATAFVTRRPILQKKSESVRAFFRVMAEAAKLLHTDKEFAFRILSKRLRLNDRKILESAYAAEVKFLEPKLTVRPEGFQAILDEVSKVDPRAKQIKPEDLIDPSYVGELESSGFLDRLWKG